MGSCYSGDHFTGDHGHYKEPLQKYSVGKVCNRLPSGRGVGVGGGRQISFTGSKPLPYTLILV